MCRILWIGRRARGIGEVCAGWVGVSVCHGWFVDWDADQRDVADGNLYINVLTACNFGGMSG